MFFCLRTAHLLGTLLILTECDLRPLAHDPAGDTVTLVINKTDEINQHHI